MAVYKKRKCNGLVRDYFFRINCHYANKFLLAHHQIRNMFYYLTGTSELLVGNVKIV